MKVLKFACGFGLALSALASTSNAQTIEFTGIGSSALFLELGQAAYSLSQTQHSTQTTCSWTTGDKTTPAISATDNGPSPSISNTGNFWVIYTAGNGTCAKPVVTASKPVYIYSNLQVDSAVGNRCVFRTGAANQQCALVVPTTGVTQVGGANLLTGITDTTSALPSNVISALNGQTFQVAASDIRPEDSLFSIVRAEASLGTSVGGSQYLGEGYKNGSTCGTIGIQGVATHGGGTVTAAGFALPGGTDPCTGHTAVNSFNAIEVGATPVVVFVNPSNPSGFGNSAIVNADRGPLSTFVNGISCRTFDLINQPRASGGQYTTTFIREPFSGTYNTFEYSIPNTVELQTSQETGITSPTTQPLNQVACKGAHGSRQRVTGTGAMVAAVLSTEDSIGYAFWSTANFKAATTSTGKYLTVDGVDPLLQNYDAGCIPTASGSGTCALSAVTFPHIVDGSYPIWSVQRLVTTSNTSSTQSTTAAQLAAAAQGEVSSSQPDFVPYTTLHVVHSHFVPPGLGSLSGTITPQNHDGACNHTEAGGDVGGIVYNEQTESDYCNEYATYVGFTGRRQ